MISSMKCHLCYSANWHKIDDWQILCPSAAKFGFESFYASGKIELARAFIEGTIKESTPRLLDVLYTCTGCGACKEQCHELSGVQIDHIELFEEMKAYIVSKGWGPLPKHAEFAKSIYKNHNPYNEPHEERFDWLTEPITDDAPVVYFVGCTSSYRQQNIAKATVKVLKASNTPIKVLRQEEWCCGSTLIRTGQIDKIKEIASHNIEALKSIGAEKVIFSCAGCFRTFKEDYPNLGFKLPFKVKHTTQFFLELIRKNKLKLKMLPQDVTYHDPCHLGRHARVYKQPRKIISKIAKFHEMPRNTTDSFCCGAGSGVRAAYPEFSKWVCKNRLDEVDEIGAKILISACPFCENNFKETVKIILRRL
ncbi:MAG: (Fe-S)-binding protein [Candidatus Helarchaeota archaeon]